MTHQQRVDWLRRHGWLQDGNETDIPKLGRHVWIDGSKGQMMYSLWLAVEDGNAILHGAGPDMTWQELTEWIDPAPVEVKPERKQKGFDFDE
jgi:hypothetical protein